MASACTLFIGKASLRSMILGSLKQTSRTHRIRSRSSTQGDASDLLEKRSRNACHLLELKKNKTTPKRHTTQSAERLAPAPPLANQASVMSSSSSSSLVSSSSSSSSSSSDQVVGRRLTYAWG